MNVGLTDAQKEATLPKPPPAAASTPAGEAVFKRLLEAPNLDEAVKKTSVSDLKLARGYAATLTKSDPRSATVTWAIMDKLFPPNGGRSHKLRLNVKRRRTQRNRGGRKHRKLRKLATRRR